MPKIEACAFLALLAAISACSEAPTAGTAKSVSTSTDNVKVLDACAILDKSVVAQSVGRAVVSAKLDSVHDGKNGSDRYSQCVFSLGGTDLIIFGAGEPSDGAAETVAMMTARIRGQMEQATSEIEPVDGLGKGALWSEELHALYVFPDNGRFYSFTLADRGLPDNKAAAIALAREIDL